MIHEQEPENFKSEFEVVSCFVEHDEKILLLHRQDHKPQGNTWGVPAGKVNHNENIVSSILREILEETGIQLDSEQIKHFRRVFVRYDEYDFYYHIFHAKLEDKPEIMINEEEHKNFRWLSPKESLSINLIQDEDSCIKLFYKEILLPNS